MRALIAISFALTIFSCSSGLKPSSTNEKAAAEMVQNYIGTPVSLSKGLILSTDEESGNFYELEISDRSSFENYPDGKIASGCLLNFYNNLTEAERSAHPTYIFTIQEPNQEEFSATFSGETLQQAHLAYNIYETLFWDLYNKKPERIIANMHPDIEGISQELLLSLLTRTDELYGELVSFRALSFEQGEELNGEDVDWILIDGLALRENETSNYDLRLSMDKENYTIYDFTLK